MTTLAIIGAGMAGRSLIYTLAKEEKSFERIVLFHSPSFAPPCSLSSTAIVAPRGLSLGHSSLGDVLYESFLEFCHHVEVDSPEGIQKIIQYTCEDDDPEKFISRYPHAKVRDSLLIRPRLLAEDQAYMISFSHYGQWLLNKAQEYYQEKLIVREDFVFEVNEQSGVLKTQNGFSESFDKIIFAGGAYNRYWRKIDPDFDLNLQVSQGSYLEKINLQFDEDSFSLTLNGNNFIWNKELNKLMVGSTTIATSHLIPPEEELKSILKKFQEELSIPLPAFNEFDLRVGLREKAPKRSPYIVSKGKLGFIGGYYKNGFTLGLKTSKILSHQFL